MLLVSGRIRDIYRDRENLEVVLSTLKGGPEYQCEADEWFRYLKGWE